MNSKAQGGANAAILVAIIAGLIMVYIIFLPASEREAVLEGKNISKANGGSSAKGQDNVLLKEFPGTLDTTKGVLDKSVPNIFLFEKTEAKEIDELNPIIVRNGWFDKKSRTVSFRVDDLENTDNLILSFDAKRHDGALTIKLNNEIIFENDIETENPAPVKLKKSLLEEDNSLEFSASSVGFKFWKTNEYSLEDIRILGDITDKSKQESRNVFTLTDEELSNIESAELRFVPYCKSEDKVGMLDVSVNSRNVFSAVPVCRDPYRQPIPVGILNSGENRVIFKTNKGSYSVEQIKLEFAEKEVKPKVYFFEANLSQIKMIESGSKDAILTIEFADDERLKRADLNINDRLREIDTEDKSYTKKLNDGNKPDLLKEGNNFIEIIPRTRLDIVEIRVQLQNK